MGGNDRTWLSNSSKGCGQSYCFSCEIIVDRLGNKSNSQIMRTAIRFLKDIYPVAFREIKVGQKIAVDVLSISNIGMKVQFVKGPEKFLFKDEFEFLPLSEVAELI
jgi:hypothetical protein